MVSKTMRAAQRRPSHAPLASRPHMPGYGLPETRSRKGLLPWKWAAERLSKGRNYFLATTRPDGRPHVVPCCFVLSGSVLYSAVDSKPKSSKALQRVRNIRALPLAALLVDHYAEDWSVLWWIRVDGTARLAHQRKATRVFHESLSRI